MESPIDLEARRDRFYALNTRLALLDNPALDRLMGQDGRHSGWGGSHVFKLGDAKVFVKRIPVTALEYENLHSTANHYHLPTFYNYGVGSAGFGAFRELITHIKTTNWVLGGKIDNFPLMYHYRLRAFPGQRAPLDPERHAKYVKYWNSDPNIDRYIRERSAAPYEILIFLEHFPHTLGPWLDKNSNGWGTVIPETQRAIRFMREQGVLHFDVHFWNIVVDDAGRPYLTDFGLALDREFMLSPEEKAFFRRHLDYDAAAFACGLGWSLGDLYRKLPSRVRKKIMKQLKIEEGRDPIHVQLLDGLEDIHREGGFPLNTIHIDQLTRHREIILLMTDFYHKMHSRDQKDAVYPHLRLRRLFAALEDESGAPTGSSADPRRSPS